MMHMRHPTYLPSLGLILGALGTNLAAHAQPPENEPRWREDLETEDEDLSLDLAGLLDLTVEAASRQKEPLREAPVPVTVITSDMIRAIGARHLRDVLVAYVPGMTLVADHNEYNVAMRGVFASSQQKILVMVDGRRLNQRAYLAAAPGFGISINPDKVKQIEVLRGPGSSVYGNVALTAVVNIVTKSGEEIDGLRARLAVGDRGQLRTELAYGSEFGPAHDLVLFGSLYRAAGESYTISANRELGRKSRHRDPPGRDNDDRSRRGAHESRHRPSLPCTGLLRGTSEPLR